MKRWVSWAMAILLFLFIPLAGLAEAGAASGTEVFAEAGPMVWNYSFAAGEALQGEGMDKIKEFFDAVQIRLTMERRAEASLGEAALISYGKPVLTLRAAANEAAESFGIYCSLMGECALMCRQDQVEDFLMTLVQMLGDLSILKPSGREQAENLARKAASMIMTIVENTEGGNPAALMDLDFYARQAMEALAESETEALDPGENEGATEKQTWHLSEAELNALVQTGLGKIRRVPILSEAFAEGRIRIGETAITENLLLEMAAETHGDTTLTVYTDGEGRVTRMRVVIPDLSDALGDPALAGLEGVEMTTVRPEENTTETSLGLLGLADMEGTLMTIRTEKSEGAAIPDLPTGKIYQVGEMDSGEMWQMIRGLGLTIAANAVNLIMDLPRIVFDTLVDRLF
ncbi:MAG: hypothetical protein IJ188_06235 [Clostridia bacterium]|nr:hypothetical protein [Clostridia bacterium]